MGFDGAAFVQHVAQRLVHEFEFSAGAGTPSLIGAAKEHPARLQLARLLPEGIGVGCGIVIDSYGGVSRQQDIIVYEKLSPVFTHNETPEASYFPVEGVIAAGEVKSTLGKAELADAFAKSKSVKVLRRRAIATEDIPGRKTVSFRHFSSTTCFAATRNDQFNQDANSLHQVYTFALCQRFGTSGNSLLENAAAFYGEFGKQLGPNSILSLKDGLILPYQSTTNSIRRAAFEVDQLMFCDQPAEAFPHLLTALRTYVTSGKTVDSKHYEKYFCDEMPPLNIAALVKLGA